jgi:hypothetical protein
MTRNQILTLKTLATLFTEHEELEPLVTLLVAPNDIRAIMPSAFIQESAPLDDLRVPSPVRENVDAIFRYYLAICK